MYFGQLPKPCCSPSVNAPASAATMRPSRPLRRRVEGATPSRSSCAPRRTATAKGTPASRGAPVRRGLLRGRCPFIASTRGEPTHPTTAGQTVCAGRHLAAGPSAYRVRHRDGVGSLPLLPARMDRAVLLAVGLSFYVL